MSKKLFITGTGTDVGKTFVTGLILKKLRESEVNAAYYKAAMSGNDRDIDGTLIPGDALYVKNISGITQPLEEMCPYIYEHAFSPHLASRIEGNPVQMKVVRQGFDLVCNKYDYITMEGSGGILCPIYYEKESLLLEDIIKELQLSCLIVADAGLGTINAVALTAAYMKSKHIPIKGIILNHFEPGDIIKEDNLNMCEDMTGLKVIACIRDGDTAIDLSIEQLLALYE